MTIKKSLKMSVTFGGVVLLCYLVFFRWHYIQARFLLGVWLGFGLVTMLLFRNKQDLMRERTQPGPNIPQWDRFLVPAFQALSGVGFAVSAWDAGYARLSPSFPPAAYAAGYLFLIAGMGLSMWAMQTNNFFSTMVRIQSDRSHKVVDGGPYRWLRHPGYAGSMLTNVMIPIVLGSLWGLIPVALFVMVLWVRTAKEDAYLRENLPGYGDYAQKVRWRLMPRIW